VYVCVSALVYACASVCLLNKILHIYICIYISVIWEGRYTECECCACVNERVRGKGGGKLASNSVCMIHRCVHVCTH